MSTQRFRRSKSLSARFALALASFAAGAAAPAAATSWAPTATQAIPVTALLNALDLGALPGTQLLTVRIGMTMRNKNALLAHLPTRAGTNGTNFLTPAQFAADHGATTTQIQKLTAYLQAAGFTNISVEPNNLMVSADGTVAQAEAAFNTKLEKLSIGGSAVS